MCGNHLIISHTPPHGAVAVVSLLRLVLSLSTASSRHIHFPLINAPPQSIDRWRITLRRSINFIITTISLLSFCCCISHRSRALALLSFISIGTVQKIHVIDYDYEISGGIY